MPLYFRPNNNEFYKNIDSMPEIKPRSKKSGVLVSDLVSILLYCLHCLF